MQFIKSENEILISVTPQEARNMYVSFDAARKYYEELGAKTDHGRGEGYGDVFRVLGELANDQREAFYQAVIRASIK